MLAIPKFLVDCRIPVYLFTAVCGCRRVQIRVMISDFAVFTAICVMVLVDFMIGLDTEKLRVPDKFEASCWLCSCSAVLMH